MGFLQHKSTVGKVHRSIISPTLFTRRILVESREESKLKLNLFGTSREVLCERRDVTRTAEWILFTAVQLSTKQITREGPRINAPIYVGNFFCFTPLFIFCLALWRRVTLHWLQLISPPISHKEIFHKFDLMHIFFPSVFSKDENAPEEKPRRKK